MKVLLDQCVPAVLRHSFDSDEVVETVYERGWASLKDGDLIAAAEVAGFDVLITTDWGTSEQHIQPGRKLSIVGLLSTSWPAIQNTDIMVCAAARLLPQGAYVQASIP